MGGSRTPSLHSHAHGIVYEPIETPTGIEIELATIRRSHPNVLLIGPDDSNERVLSKLLPCCRTPLYERNPECGTLTVGWGTVVMRRIESMSQQEQRILHGWFKPARGGVQVVSLASPRLFELVSAGAFQKALFYRLNVIMLMT